VSSRGSAGGCRAHPRCPCTVRRSPSCNSTGEQHAVSQIPATIRRRATGRPVAVPATVRTVIRASMQRSGAATRAPDRTEAGDSPAGPLQVPPRPPPPPPAVSGRRRCGRGCSGPAAGTR
jgi:hypothetical protein